MEAVGEKLPTGPINSTSPLDKQKDAIRRLIDKFGPKSIHEQDQHMFIRIQRAMTRLVHQHSQTQEKNS